MPRPQRSPGTQASYEQFSTTVAPGRLVWYAGLPMTKCLIESSNRRDVDGLPTM